MISKLDLVLRLPWTKYCNLCSMRSLLADTEVNLRSQLHDDFMRGQYQNMGEFEAGIVWSFVRNYATGLTTSEPEALKLHQEH